MSSRTVAAAGQGPTGVRPADREGPSEHDRFDDPAAARDVIVSGDEAVPPLGLSRGSTAPFSFTSVRSATAKS